MAYTTVVLFSDLHTGSEAGISNSPKNDTQNALHIRWSALVDEIGPVDYAICVGDAIDGGQAKDQGKGLTDDVNQQKLMATGLISQWNAKEYFLVGGTHYHVRDGGTDAEKDIVHNLQFMGEKASFHRKLNLNINGWFTMQCRHHIGGSNAGTHTRHTAPARSKQWNILNAARDGEEWASLCVFGHRHYYVYNEDAWGAAMVLPCWQALGSAYGEEICDGHIDIGLVVLKIGETKEESWKKKAYIYPAKVESNLVTR